MSWKRPARNDDKLYTITMTVKRDDSSSEYMGLLQVFLQGTGASA